MSQPPLRAVVFDLDGTLVDSAPDLHAAVNLMFDDMGLAPMPLAQVRGFVGNGIGKLVERCLEAAKQPAKGAPLARAVARFKAHYGAAPAALTRPFDGVEALLGGLTARGLLLGVCTNKPEDLTRAVLEGTGLDRHLRAVVGGDTTVAMKPDPAPLLHCLRQLGAGVEEALYVGDSEIDADTAAAAGMAFALWSGGYRKRPLALFEDCFVFHDFAALGRHVLERAAY